LLASTPDANTTDPYIQQEAAVLDYNRQNIFNFLETQIGYNSYSGSLRGARGTLWSDAGNALDVASLGVALMRASGIPAQYVGGTLSTAQAQALILSMFPASFQTVGYVPAGTKTSDPANDRQLLSERESHYWLEFNTGSGWVNADPLMAAVTGGSQIGQTYTAATGTFTQIPQSLEQTTEVSLTAEIYSQATAVLGLGASPFQDTVVLDQTFDDSALVGRPLTIGNFVTQKGIGTIISEVTNTYTPYLVIGDEALPDSQLPDAIVGQQYQEVLTNFPLANQILTGLFLNMTTAGAGTTSHTYTATLVDRIGYAARQGLAPAGNLSVDPAGPPIVTPYGLTTLNILPGLQSPAAAQLAQERETEAIANVTSGGNPSQVVQVQALIDMARVQLATLSGISDQETANLQRVFSAAAYFTVPRITAFSSQFVTTNNHSGIVFSFDLIHDSIRVIASMGQNLQATLGLPYLRGIFDSALEAQLLPAGPGSQNLSAVTLIQQSLRQGIPLAAVNASNMSLLQSLNLPVEAMARITTAVQNGLTVIVPTQALTVNGTPTTAWYEFNPTTGEIVAVGQHGEHQGITEVVIVSIATLILFFTPAFVPHIPIIPPIDWTTIGRFAKGTAGLVAGGFAGVYGNLLAGSAGTLGISGVAIVGLAEFLPFFLTTLGAAALLTAFSLGDPPLTPDLINLNLPFTTTPDNSSSIAARQQPNRTAGLAGGTIQASSAAAYGQMTASWTSATLSSFLAESLGATDATIVDSQGMTVGSGKLALSSQTLTPLSISGNAQYNLNGTGTLSFYGPAESSLGVSGNWSNYTATVTGNVSITLTVPDGALTLNGQPLPAGTYTITTSSATLSGNGHTSSPNFAGSASITTTNGTVNLGPGSGNITVGGNALDPTNGITLDGYTGNISVAAGGGGNTPDNVTLNGNAANVLSVVPSAATLTTNQNTSVTFQANVNTSLADTYNLTAQAPAGWTVTIDSSGNVTATPAPGLQGGTYPIQVVAQSSSDPNLVAQTTIEVTITPTQPGMTLAVNPDPIFTVPYAGAQVPTAFRAVIQNTGPAADTYNLTFANVPSGFTLASSATSDTVPAGQTGIVGLYLIPTAGSVLPAPGTPLSFQVTATSTTNPALTQMFTVTFTMPAIDAVTVVSNPVQVSTVPGFPATATVTLQNVGNVAASAALTFTTDTGLTLTGLNAAPISLTIGQTATETVQLTPAANVPLNTTLQATVTVGPAVAQNVVSVVNVNTTNFATAGQALSVSADVLNGVTAPEQGQASFTVLDSSGNVVYTSPAVPLALASQTNVTTINLGTLDTSGFAPGQYTIQVSIADSSGNPIPGATGTASLVIGAPVTASLAVSADAISPTDSNTVFNTLTVGSQTLLGSVTTDGASTDIALDGNLAYVANTQDIAVVDLSDPTNPRVVATFGKSDINQGGLSLVQLDGTNLVVASQNPSSASSFNLLVYALANPDSPQLLSNTAIPCAFPSDLVIQGTTALVPIEATSNDGNGNITGQSGDFLAVDLSNPSSPQLAGVLFNTLGSPQGSSSNQWDAVPVTGQLTYVAGSTSAGTNTQLGSGAVLVVNTVNPASMSVATTLDIPGTVQALAIAVNGNEALVVGTTGGWQSPYTQAGLSGNITLTLLDISNPLDPTVIGSTVVTGDTFPDLGTNPTGKLRAVYLGNGQFAVSDTQAGGPVLLVVNASDPNNLMTSTVATPSDINGMTVTGNLLLATSSTGLSVYQISALSTQSVTASVTVPTSGTAAVVANSFSVQPNQIIPGNGTETLVWHLTLPPGAAPQQITWETTVSGPGAGQIATVVNGATIQVGNQTFTLPGSNVAGIPETQSIVIPVGVVAPGVPAIESAAVAAGQVGKTGLANQLNNLGTALTSLVQTPTSAVYQGQAAAAITSIIGQITADPFLAPYVSALTTGSTAIAAATTPDEVDAAVINLGTALNALAQAISDEAVHGFTLGLADSYGIIQPGAPTQFTITMQNTGTASTTYDLGVSGLPAGVTPTFNRTSITLGAGQQIPAGSTFVTLSLSESGDTLIPADLTVTATAETAPELTTSTPGHLTLRPEVLQVATVTANPVFTNPGSPVDVTAKFQSVVNEPRQVSVSYTVTDASGNVLYTDTAPVTVPLAITTGLTTVDLGSFDTTGFATGADTITVTVTDLSSQPLPSATGQGSVTIGAPVTATLSVSPTAVPVTNFVGVRVTNALQINSSTPLPDPLTLAGQVSTTPTATSVALFQNGTQSLAYVAGTNGIDIVDVSTPAAPVDKGSFAGDQIVQGGFIVARVANIAGTSYLLVASSVTHTSASSGTTLFLVYALTNPLSPTLVSKTDIPYVFLGDLLVEGNTVIMPTWAFGYVFGFFSYQAGTVLAIDVSNPAAPKLEGELYNQVGPPEGGTTTQLGGVIVNNQIAYIASSTSTGGDTRDGVGRVLVVNYSDPTHLTTSEVDIPGTYQIVDVAVQGNRALVVGRTGGNSDGGFSGNLTLSVLDTSTPASPKLIGTTLVSPALIGLGALKESALALGNGLFALSEAEVNGNPVLLVVDPTDPNNILVTFTPVPTLVNEMAVSGNLLYTTSAQGLGIYNIGQVASVPVTVSVRVPHNTNVAVVSGSATATGSFSSVQPKITPGTTYDTITWTGTLTYGASNVAVTWQSAVSNLNPGQVVPVTQVATINFVSQGTPGTVTLSGTAVTGVPILAVIPGSETVQPGGTVTYEVQLTNPTASSITYDLYAEQTEDRISNFDINNNHQLITLAAGATVDVPLQVVSLATAPAGPSSFTVGCYDASYNTGIAQTVQVNLTLAGPPVPQATPNSYGVVAAFAPRSATDGAPSQAALGQRTSAEFVIQLTNTGSTDESYSLQASGLPNWVVAGFGNSNIDVPPGAGNFRDVGLTLTAEFATAPGTYPFTVTATAADNTSTTTIDGTLTVLPNGVSVRLTPATGAPGSTFQLTVTNTGTVADTYDLTLGGPAALVATLGSSTVALAPGASQSIPITTTAANFAAAGPLQLVAAATSQTTPAVTASATTDLAVPNTTGMTALFAPTAQTLPRVGSTTFTLLVNNTGNVQDSYTATIIGTSGPVAASLTGLDGTPTQTIPIFILPGLSTGALALPITLTGAGSGTVTVQVTSLSNPALSTAVTATVVTAGSSTTGATTTTVTSDQPGGSSYGQTVTFTAVVAGSGGTPAGSVRLQIDGSDVGAPVDLVNGTASFSTSSLTAGTHQVVAFYTSSAPSFSNSDNSASPFAAAVAPAVLTIEPTPGQSVVYGNSIPALTYTVSGLQNNDPNAIVTGSLGTTATAGSPVGAYPFTLGTLGADSNYTLQLAADAPTFTVLQATPAVNVQDVGGMYNGSTFAATATVNGGGSLEGVGPALAYYSGTDASGTPLSGAPSSAGTYTVVATFVGSADYTAASASTTFTISPAPLTVTADDQSTVYGAALPVLTVSYSGFVNGQTAAVLTGGPNLTTSAATGAAPGAYPIVASAGTLADPNYVFQFVNGTLTITQDSTTTTLSVSAPTPLAGIDSVTLTATVAAAAPGSGVCTGSVDFSDTTTGTDLGSVPLVNGTAVLTVGPFGAGAHAITATYSGDGNFLSGTGTTSLRALAPASLSGTVFADFNEDGRMDFGEAGISGVSIHLTGTDDLGHSVDRTTRTNCDGTYAFLDLRPGTYSLTKVTRPCGYTPGVDTVGSAGGTLSTKVADQFIVQLVAGASGTNYNYAEVPAPRGHVEDDQTAGLGFWNSEKGQALILALNGGTGTRLGDWLSATLPHIFGAGAGANDLAGKSNAAVAALFRNEFREHGPKLDAEVLATALAVYVTNATLDNTRVGEKYDFEVRGYGVGTATVDVGCHGAAFGVADGTRLTVMELLRATDARAAGGQLYHGSAALRDSADDVYSALNRSDDDDGCGGDGEHGR
jgi:uncharacterized membrane protein